MITSKIEYLGGLRTKCTHLQSGKEILTDAPIDNNGKGEAFSPTDLVATAYVSCVMTIMGIHCDQNDIPFTSAIATVEKIMASGPRRISQLNIQMDLSGNNWNKEIAERVIRIGKACPVANSVSNDIEVNFEFKY